MQRKLFFLAYFFLPMAIGSATCFAQQYPIINYTPRDGLVNSRVRRIMQDDKGRMLFITYGGLSIYDGTQFTNYTQQDGLANELVNDVTQIAPDSFLVATNTQKLNAIVRGKMGEYKTRDNFCPTINRFLKSSDGNLYVASDEGLFLMQSHGFHRLPVLDKNGTDLGAYLDKIVEVGNFFLMIPWNISQQGKLILYDKQRKVVQDVFSRARTYDAVKDKAGRIWLSLRMEKKSLILWLLNAAV